MFAAMDDDKAWFGFRRIEAAEKPALVRGVFERVAGRYDLMNDLMSGGIHRLWKADLIDWLNPQPGEVVLDVAGGTGDIAFRYLRRAGKEAGAIVCDLTPAMLSVGRDRAIDRGVVKGIDWLAGDAQSLPLAERSVDAYTIAFGLRNVTDIDRALAEARRVLKPGGRHRCPPLRLADLTIVFRGLRNIGRLLTVARTLARHRALAPFAEHIEGAGLAPAILLIARLFPRGDAAKGRPGERLSAARIALGPVFIKFGQL